MDYFSTETELFEKKPFLNERKFNIQNNTELIFMLLFSPFVASSDEFAETSLIR